MSTFDWLLDDDRPIGAAPVAVEVVGAAYEAVALAAPPEPVAASVIVEAALSLGEAVGPARPRMWPFGSWPIPLAGELVGSFVLGEVPDAGPGVPKGWSRAGWRARLVYLAEGCEAVNPRRCVELKAMIAALDGATF